MIVVEEDPTTERKRRQGARLRGHRLIRGLGLEEVAEMTGIPLSSLEAYETGKRTPGVARAVALAQAYGITVEDLFPHEGEK